MEILSSGSFVNLENQGKIEQLIYTAKEIAAAAVGTDGFVNDEENNKRLALEIWQGAEYMTRDHEEAQVKNIFINNFLDRLRELGVAPETVIIKPENSVNSLKEESPDGTGAPRDEFLGFVATSEVSEQENAEQSPSAGGNAPETTAGGSAAPASNATPNSRNEKVGDNFVEHDESFNEQTLEIENAEPEKNETHELNQSSEGDKTESIQIGECPHQNFGAITLPEKEPYQFDKCTVTATIQLLPSDTGIRRAVVSVRTHDFAPQISVIELTGGASSEQLLPELEKAFEKYKTDLPVKVMDKMKREKSAGKKQSNKAAVETKSATTGNSTSGSQAKTETKTVETAIVPKSENNPAATNTVSVSPPAAMNTTENASRSNTNAKNDKPKDDRQGNLFGF